MVPFKDILFKQQAYWVSELDVDALSPYVRLQLISDPDSNEIECDVLFEKAMEVTVNYHGDEEDSKSRYLCTLLDVSDKLENGKHYYFIATDTVEVAFHTAATPKIDWLDPNKPYQKWRVERIKGGKDA